MIGFAETGPSVEKVHKREEKAKEEKSKRKNKDRVKSARRIQSSLEEGIVFTLIDFSDDFSCLFAVDVYTHTKA